MAFLKSQFLIIICKWKHNVLLKKNYNCKTYEMSLLYISKNLYMTRIWIYMYHEYWYCLQLSDVIISGLLTVVGKCQPGYYCPSGSKVATEVICTAGHYCGEGTQDPTPCSNGTFSNVTGLTAGSECWNCTPGYYCNGQGLTAVSGPCKEGRQSFYTVITKHITPIHFILIFYLWLTGDIVWGWHKSILH